MKRVKITLLPHKLSFHNCY